VSAADSYTMLDCGICGLALLGKDPRPGRYSDGEEIKCTDCGAVNSISCDGEAYPYVSGYVCQHGKDSDTLCDQCEIEDGGGVGEVTP
jgi:hypothetical protein